MDMDSRITDYSCNEFARQLSDKVSVPGGGGAAALVGALSMALCSMAGNFTVGKKKYAQYEDELKAILKEYSQRAAIVFENVDRRLRQ